MISINRRNRRLLLVTACAVFAASSASAQITFSPSNNPGPQGSVVCTNAGGTVFLSGDTAECDGAGSVIPDTLSFTSGAELETFSGSVANFGGAVNFSSNNVQFNNSNVAFGGGSATFNNTVSFVGPSVTFQTDVDFDSTIDTSGIDNAGFITTDALLAGGIGTANLSIASQLSVTSGADINMGDNIIHGVAAGVADTDAVNVAQLNAATSGVTADISALETATTTHTTQIANLETTTATHTTQIANLETTTATHTTQIADLQASSGDQAAAIDTLETTTATHTTQIANLETTTATHTSQISGLQASDVAQNTAITGVQAVNATQTTQISGLQTTTATHTSQIAAIQTVNTTQAGQISALEAAQDLVQNQVDTLFDLRGRDRRDMKQGVASAMAMAQTLMPSNPGGISYAVNGATFRGEYAVGASFSYRLNTEAPMAISVGASFAGNKNNGVRVGVAGEF